MKRIALAVLVLLAPALSAADSLDICHETREFRLYRAQEEIIGNYELLDTYKHITAQDREVEKESGVIDLRARYSNGQLVVLAKGAIRGYWQEYKELKGIAKSAKKVKHSYQNPCEKLEQAEDAPTAAPPPLK